MPRKKLPPDERRDRQINIRVNVREIAALTRFADAERIGVAEYLRRRGLHRKAPPASVLQVDPELRLALHRIGINLNQAVRLAHRGRWTAAEWADLVAALEVLAARIENILDPGGGA